MDTPDRIISKFVYSPATTNSSYLARLFHPLIISPDKKEKTERINDPLIRALKVVSWRLMTNVNNFERDIIFHWEALSFSPLPRTLHSSGMFV